MSTVPTQVEEVSSEPHRHPTRLWIDRAMFTAWIANWIAILAASTWLFLDGYLVHLPWDTPTWLFFLEQDASVPLSTEVLPYSVSIPRQVAALILAIVCLASWFVIAVGYIFASPANRSFRTVAALLLNITLWVVLLTSGRRLTDMGRTERLKAQAEPIIAFASRLDREWNKITDAHQHSSDPTLVTFNAYPVHSPRMLMFLGDQKVPGTSLVIRSAERTSGEAIRLELSESHGGFWLEWRLDLRDPQKFVSGLEAPLEPARSVQLINRLYLVEYR